MVLEATGGETGTGGRTTDYESRTRTGVTGGVTGGNTGEGSRMAGTGGTRETNIGGTGMGTRDGKDDKSYTFATAGGNSGGYDRGHASASTTIPTSTVAREYVFEPGIKESNTNVKSYMAGPGAGSGISTGTIPGTVTGTGSGTRMYTAGRARADENAVPHGEVASGARGYSTGGDIPSSRAVGGVGILSTGKDVDRGTRTYPTGNGSAPVRITGDIGTSSHGGAVGSGEVFTPRAARDTDTSFYSRVGSSGTGFRAGEDALASRPRTDPDRLSYLKDTVASLGLGAEVRDGERSRLLGEVSRVTDLDMKSPSSGSTRPGTHRTGEAPSARTTTGQLHSNRDFSSGIGPSRGTGASTRRYTIGGDTYSVGIRGGGSSANRIGDITSTIGRATETTGDSDTRSHKKNRSADQRTPVGERRASYTGTRDQPSTLSYIKDVASTLGIGSGSGTGTKVNTNERSYTAGGDTSRTAGDGTYTTGGRMEESTLGALKGKAKDVATPDVRSGPVANTHTEGGGRAYTSGDTPSSRIGDSRTFVTGRDSTLSRTGGDSQTYATSGDTSTTKSSDTLSHTKDTTGRDTMPDAEYYRRDFTTRDTGTDIGPHTTSREYDIGSTTASGSGNTHGQGSRSCAVVGGASPSATTTMASTAQKSSYGKGFAPGSRPTDTPPTMETRSGAHMPDYENRETMTTGNQGASGNRTGRYTIIHPAKPTGDQARAEERIERETRRAGVEQRMEMDREQTGRQGSGERYIIEGGTSDREADRRRKEGETRTVQMPGSQPSRRFRDDASTKHDRIRLELEQELDDIAQEALRIAKGKRAARTTGATSPDQKYSPPISGDKEPIERKRDREDMARNITPPRDRQEARIPGDFDTQERHNRRIITSEAESSVRDDATTAFSQAQPGNPSREPILSNPERQQQQEPREREAEKSARESSMERHRTADVRTGSSPDGMRTTMRGSSEYKEQKADDSVRATEKKERDERKVTESQFEGDDGEGVGKGILRMVGGLLKT